MNKLEITVKETVERSVILEIGEDITTEEADKLLKMAEDDDECKLHTKMYSTLNDYLGDNITDSEGFFDIQVFKTK